MEIIAVVGPYVLCKKIYTLPFFGQIISYSKSEISEIRNINVVPILEELKSWFMQLTIQQNIFDTD